MHWNKECTIQLVPTSIERICRLPYSRLIKTVAHVLRKDLKPSRVSSSNFSQLLDNLGLWHPNLGPFCWKTRWVAKTWLIRQAVTRSLPSPFLNSKNFNPPWNGIFRQLGAFVGHSKQCVDRQHIIICHNFLYHAMLSLRLDYQVITTYHLQTNCQAELYNLTIVTRFQHEALPIKRLKTKFTVAHVFI